MPNIKHFKITNGEKKVEAFFEICDTFNSRMRGLMFRRNPTYLFFEFGMEDLNPIHSFFIIFPFDAVYLDVNYKVVSLFPNIRPFTPYLEPSTPNKYLLETPVGFIKSLNLKVGDKLLLSTD